MAVIWSKSKLNMSPSNRRWRTLRMICGRCLLGLAVWLVCRTGVAADDAGVQFFEREVRPILVEKCIRCHGEKKQSGGLRLDSRRAILKGGDTTVAIVPGNVAKSLLIRAVRRDGDLEMPPDEELQGNTIRVLEHWVKIGAPWPASPERLSKESQKNATQNHWAFQPVQQPSIPSVKQVDWIKTPVDAFVKARLEENHLVASPAANKRTLIRRVTYALTGLPPALQDVDRFVADADPRAYIHLVERLLASPQYGEHWARHWLDVTRYSDTKGYVYAREERHWVHAWAYRDWVVRALNRDMPYHRFLLLQLAADQVEDRDSHDLAAMGFLTLGRRFLGVKRDIIDDRIDVVCRGTMGLTVSCARCHDHKYDPIPTADYYSLYGVFENCIERLDPLERSLANQDFESELRKRQAQLQTKLVAYRAAASGRARDRLSDYLYAQSELHKYPADGFDQIFQVGDLLPAIVRRWERYLREAEGRGDPVFGAWHRFAAIPKASFAAQAVDVTNQLRTAPGSKLHPIIASAFTTPPSSFRQVCDRYGAVFSKAKKQWEATLAAAKAARVEVPVSLSDKNFEELRRVLYGPRAPCQVPDGPIVHSDTYFDSASSNELWKLQGEVDRWIIKSDVAAPYALTLIDQAISVEPRIFIRGNPLNHGRQVPRQFLSVLAGEQRQPFRDGSGRLELARAIIDPNNPLTARVIVNRVWAYHFGNGLVSTPSDFGTRAGRPSHPQLLDWLASEFVSTGWSLKELQRWIVLSATYCQSFSGPTDRGPRMFALQADPENRLLWRMNAQRLTFEEFRDSLLAATNELDRTVGGKPAMLFEQPFPKRRTLYGLVDRQYLPGALRIFDFANPDLHVPKRSETTVPQQALFFMNHPFVLERAKALAKLVESDGNSRKRIATLFRHVLQRNPTEFEFTDALALIDAVASRKKTAPRAAVADWQYGYGEFDEVAKRVRGFIPLPHFTGLAWQGGSKWPDAKLGWVQLTANGGHPGNDRRHAAIRRWTATDNMTIKIQTELKHEPTQGDGIRAFVVSSHRGVLQSAPVHHGAVELNIESLSVSKGEAIDFVVDIGKVLNNDQYLWNASIAASLRTWNSRADFTTNMPQQLQEWEQLAHVLLCTNEFMFVD